MNLRFRLTSTFFGDCPAFLSRQSILRCVFAGLDDSMQLSCRGNDVVQQSSCLQLLASSQQHACAFQTQIRAREHRVNRDVAGQAEELSLVHLVSWVDGAARFLIHSRKP